MTSWLDDFIKPEPEVLADFVLTGTGVYGPKTPGKSDIDIVLKRDDAVKLFAALTEKGILLETFSNSGYPEDGPLYFNIGPLRFNIIAVYTDETFDWWQTQTDRMKKCAPIEDRAERLRVFRGGEP